MAVSFTLGKDATITGVTNTNVRSVTATVEGTQIDVTRRGDTERKYRSGLKEATIEIEMLDGAPAVGAEITVTHTNSGLGGTFVVTAVGESQPIDDVVTFNVTAKLKTPAAAGS